MKLRLDQTIRPELRLAAQQILTMRLLALPQGSLEEAIENALDENDLLERVDGASSRSDEIPEDSERPREEMPMSGPGGDHHRDERSPVSTEEREPLALENLASAGVSLAEHLLGQLRLVCADGVIRTAGEGIIWNLDDNGYLRAGLEEIAAIGPTSVAVVDRALVLVQGFDPTGVAARDLRECLTLQLRAEQQVDPVALEIVERHFDALARRRHEQLARALRLPPSRVAAAIEHIRRLDPKPGQRFVATDARPVRPEITIEKIAGEYVVTLNDQGLPALRVARSYDRLGEHLGAEERRFIAERRQAARWFVEAIEQRRRTLRQVAEAVVRIQRDFFERGPAHLLPLGMRQVADEIRVHESTVSRATSAKFIDTPHGVFAFKSFFPPGVAAIDGGLVATAAAKDSLRALIAGEDPGHPLSDIGLASALRRRGFDLARRTVAKYRADLAIPPRHQRRCRSALFPGGLSGAGTSENACRVAFAP